jgi:RNA recognition motif-containing protein
MSSSSYTANALSASLFDESVPEPKKSPKKNKKKRSRSSASSASIASPSSTSSTSSTSSSTTSTTSASIISALDKAFAKPQPFTSEIVNVVQQKTEAETKKHVTVDNSDRTIFFGNVPIETKANALKTMLRELLGDGCIESVRFRSIAVAGTKVNEANNFKLYRKASAIKEKYKEDRATKNAYVVFKTVEFAEQAVELNGHLFQDNHLRVDYAGDGARHKKDKQRKSVFLGNLPFNIEEEKIHSFFARGVSGGAESIVNVRVIRDRGSNMVGINCD